jgi:electron transfer flavoprotein beta subunit
LTLNDAGGTTATVERDVPGGVEVMEVNLPFALSAAKGMAEQRIPNMRGIMAARTKPLDGDSSCCADNVATPKSFELPPPKGAVKMIPARRPGS